MKVINTNQNKDENERNAIKQKVVEITEVITTGIKESVKKESW